MSRLSHLLRATSITADMIERRDYVRSVCKDRYAEVTSDARRIIQDVAKQQKKSLVEACIQICKDAVKNGHGTAVNVVIAATVDLYEAKP